MNVDLIGCGGFGEQLALYVRDVDEMTLRATYDPNPAAASRVAARFGATPYADLATLLGTSGSDAVLVATPHHTHHDVVLQALEAGRHVFCEKPMARTVDECYDMLEAAERLGLRLTVGHKRRLRPTHAYVAEIAHSGALGRPITGNVQGYHWQVYDQRTQWWGRAAEVGGLLHWAGVHDFDTLRFIIGEVASVFAMAGPKLRVDTDYSDSLSVLLRFANGAVVTLESSPYYPLAAYRRAFSYQFVYERGGIWYDPTRMTVEHQVEGGPRVVRTFNDWGFEHAFTSELRSFARWAMHGEQPLLTAEDGLRCVEIIQAAYISAAESRLVHLPLERHETRGV